MEKLKVGCIGVGNRGAYLSEELCVMPDVILTAVCDALHDRAQTVADHLGELSGYRPAVCDDPYELILRNDVDAVVIATSWNQHTPLSVFAMEQGKYCASEVGGATSIEECWKLVDTYERTKTPFMMLENCCYGKTELTLLNMVRQGIFGELVNLGCGYTHYGLVNQKQDGVLKAPIKAANRLRTADLYPTHGVGPMAKILDINHGNRFVSICSAASKGVSVAEHAKDFAFTESGMGSFNGGSAGDLVRSVIKCARGETLTVTYNTTLPRPYSRAGLVQGTHGIWSEDTGSIFIEGRSKTEMVDGYPKEYWEPFENYFDEFVPDLWKWFESLGITAEHGGMDYLVLRAFVESALIGTPAPIDVYDMATWISITALSEESIARGGAPVMFPDFTNGRFMYPSRGEHTKYSIND